MANFGDILSSLTLGASQSVRRNAANTNFEAFTPFAMSNQSANQVFAGPSSGGAAMPAFRALAANDIPNISAAKITSGLTSGRVTFFSSTLTDSADFTFSGTALSLGASSGGGEFRSHQNNSGFYMALKTDTGLNLSGMYRNNPGFTSGFPFYYSTATGDVGCNAFFGSGNKVVMQVQGSDISRFASGGMEMVGGKNFIFDGTTGSKLGSASTQKLAFWGATPVTQRADFSSFSDTTGGNTMIPGLAATGDSDANDNFAKVQLQLDEIRQILKDVAITV